MMIYYTINKEQTMVDSISYDFDSLQKKFPDTKIFGTENLKNIYDI